MNVVQTTLNSGQHVESCTESVPWPSQMLVISHLFSSLKKLVRWSTEELGQRSVLHFCEVHHCVLTILLEDIPDTVTFSFDSTLRDLDGRSASSDEVLSASVSLHFAMVQHGYERRWRTVLTSHLSCRWLRHCQVYRRTRIGLVLVWKCKIIYLAFIWVPGTQYKTFLCTKYQDWSWNNYLCAWACMPVVQDTIRSVMTQQPSHWWSCDSADDTGVVSCDSAMISMTQRDLSAAPAPQPPYGWWLTESCLLTHQDLQSCTVHHFPLSCFSVWFLQSYDYRIFTNSRLSLSPGQFCPYLLFQSQHPLLTTASSTTADYYT